MSVVPPTHDEGAAFDQLLLVLLGGTDIVLIGFNNLRERIPMD